MADIWSKQKRSEVMSLIRSRGNKATELRLIEIYREHGITGWRRNQPLLGKPDFTFRREKVVVFVDGCFWHGCPRCYKRPKSNRKFWDTKIANNRKRDRLVNRELRGSGWRVVRIWQHQLDSSARVAGRVRRYLELGNI
ncbi:MAG: DNA mismatch endonuclease Vsr [Nitrosomonadales bacterium]|nr:DNA mismatch endonuclease Vsr [Nitrosomonadales bacterium]